MKSKRHHPSNRHLDQEQRTTDMNNSFNQNDMDPAPYDDGSMNTNSDNEGATLEVDVGNAMPPSAPSYLPMLHTEHQGTASDTSEARSMLAEGMHFVGNALLRGPCSVAGLVEGNLTQANGSQVAVVVTETGRVKGDITAQKISVMGHTDGILDSGQGEVSLHDTASVHGLVRYGRIQVNGADLNATLERVAVQKSGF